MTKEPLKTRIKNWFSSREGAGIALISVVSTSYYFIASSNFPLTFPFFQPRFIHAQEIKINQWRQTKSGDEIAFVHNNLPYAVPCYRAEKKELTALCDAVRFNGVAVVKNMVFLQPYSGATNVLITQGTLLQPQSETPIAISQDRQNRFVRLEQIWFQIFLALALCSVAYLAAHIYIVVQDIRRERACPAKGSLKAAPTNFPQP